ncbi:hypothetical protein AVW14_17665 [Stenotrophomonas maltophilia]|nr:hypothetical protein AVW14_17665 [Stenotrophomonas maltophilia]
MLDFDWNQVHAVQAAVRTLSRYRDEVSSTSIVPLWIADGIPKEGIHSVDRKHQAQFSWGSLIHPVL